MIFFRFVGTQSLSFTLCYASLLQSARGQDEIADRTADDDDPLIDYDNGLEYIPKIGFALGALVLIHVAMWGFYYFHTRSDLDCGGHDMVDSSDEQEEEEEDEDEEATPLGPIRAHKKRVNKQRLTRSQVDEVKLFPKKRRQSCASSIETNLPRVATNARTFSQLHSTQNGIPSKVEPSAPPTRVPSATGLSRQMTNTPLGIGHGSTIVSPTSSIAPDQSSKQQNSSKQ